MKKLVLLGLIGAVAVVFVAKKTHMCSYASTFVSQVERDAKNQIPGKFELERIRNEIGEMDSDISQMIRPIAEYKVVIEKMRKDITKSQSNIEEQKKNLLGVVDDLKDNPTHLVINSQKYSAVRVRQQLQRDLEMLKKKEKQVKTQQEILEAKEAALAATQEQLAKLISKKREYELRLAQLEADEERLQTERIGSDIKIDSGRATQIDNSLAELEQRQKVLLEEVRMRTGNIVNVPLQERSSVPVDLQAIRQYLEGHETPEKTASK
jgi:septal ring factor EnvC (AmiA/AmiB activator)